MIYSSFRETSELEDKNVHLEITHPTTNVRKQRMFLTINNNNIVIWSYELQCLLIKLCWNQKNVAPHHAHKQKLTAASRITDKLCRDIKGEIQ